VGNALLSHGYTLTIDPGVIVKFNDSTVLQIDGELDAIGNAANRITFTSNQISPTPGDWGKIHFSDTCIDAVFDTAGNYLSGSILKYCDIKYGGRLGFGQIHIINSSPYFSHCNISYSSTDGIFSINKTYSIDSSVVSNCNGIGLYFDRYYDYSCSTLIQDDSIINNPGGGIKFNSTFSWLNCGYHHVTIMRRNVFISNSSFALLAPGDGYDSLIVTDNIFENNNCSQGVFGCSLTTYAIECNKFINNQSPLSIIGIGLGDSYNAQTSSFYFQNNLIEGNTVTGNGASLISNVNRANYKDIFFRFNTIKNNSCSLGQICSIGGNPTSTLQVHFNNFINNMAKTDISLLSPGAVGSGWRYLDMSYNNIVNPGCQYEFYNNVPYGGPNIRIDSNYWGNVSTQHMDSVVYDYFDYGNLSVVFYSPLFNSSLDIDTTCHLTIPTFIASIHKIAASLFPNPFNTSATLTFSTPLHDATLRIYNMYGQMMQQREHVSGREITVQRENLCSGIYIYEVSEAGRKITAGKAVVY
jgi:hypothetical protein